MTQLRSIGFEIPVHSQARPRAVKHDGQQESGRDFQLINQVHTFMFIPLYHYPSPVSGHTKIPNRFHEGGSLKVQARCADGPSRTACHQYNRREHGDISIYMTPHTR